LNQHAICQQAAGGCVKNFLSSTIHTLSYVPYSEQRSEK
jgi:hypothetical protein